MKGQTNNKKNSVFKEEFQKQKQPAQPEKQDAFQDIPMTLFGMDYYRVIYFTLAVLAILMITVYFSVEEEKIKRVTLVQGTLSIFLIGAMAYYHTNLNKKQNERKRKQQKQL